MFAAALQPGFRDKMEDKKIIDAYLRKDKLLTPSALQAIKKGAVPLTTSSLVITDELFPKDSIKVIKNLERKKKEISTEDFVGFYTSKLQQMKKIILSRLQKNFISINKIGADRREIYTIGIVRDLKKINDKSTLELEDMTTSVTVMFDEPPDVETDDVIALQALAGGDVLFGKKVFPPDVPLRQPTTGEGKACFVSDLHLNETPKFDIERFFSWFSKQGINYLFIAGDIGDTVIAEEMLSRYCMGKRVFIIPGKDDNEDEYPQLPITVRGATCLSNPSMVEINGVKILIIHNFPEHALQKRYLGKSKCVLPEDFLVLDKVPDIINSGYTHKPYVSNYKSITLANSGSLLGEFKPVVIDLATREVIQENIS